MSTGEAHSQRTALDLVFSPAHRPAVGPAALKPLASPACSAAVTAIAAALPSHRESLKV